LNVAAFFDVDGTLLPAPSLERRFLRYLRRRGEVRVSNYLRWLREFLGPMSRRNGSATLTTGAGASRGWATRIAQNKAYLAGVPAASMDTWLCWLGRHPIELVPEALWRIQWHARQGHMIFLLTGTLAPLARAVAQRIPVPVEVCATQLEMEGGRFCGRVCGEAVCGPAKARAMERLATKISFDLARSYAYGDSFADRWMLARVGTPFVVQTTNSISWRLAWLAQQQGWPVLRWGETHQDEKFHHKGTEGQREKPIVHAVQVKCR
jgi:HAD superfamily hydrolase (TIGR01490 family)